MNCLKTKYTFWLYKSKTNTLGQSPVYMRITVGKKHTELATGIYIFEKNWNDKTGRIKGQHIPDIDILNLKLDSLDKAFNQVLKSFIEADIAYTPQSFKKRLKGNDADIKSLVELFTDHNNGMEELKDIDYSDIFDNRKNITLIHCMAHARRKFNEALENDYERAAYALNEIQELYAIECSCKEQNADFETTQQIGADRSVPILGDMRLWLQRQYPQVLPKSPIGKAITYSLERWCRLSVYVLDGRLNIDNNPVENSIRPVALGRDTYRIIKSNLSYSILLQGKNVATATVAYLLGHTTTKQVETTYKRHRPKSGWI